MRRLLDLVTAADPAVRNQSLDALCETATAPELLAQCAELDAFRRRADNLYERVRALFFLYAINRFHLPARLETAAPSPGLIPFRGYEQLLHRRFEEAIDTFLGAQSREGPTDGLCSALAAAFHRLAFQTLADQVRRSVRSVRGNQWMFRMGHPTDQPLRIRPELLRRGPDGAYPVLRELTPVRMDLTHCGWSDIFFLGMDFPEGARVLNVSVDLGIHGRDGSPRPPVSAWLRVLDEPVLRLTSVDLGATADLNSLSDVFDFAKDYLGLLKAAVIAAGIVPPGIEGSGQSLAELLARIVGPGRGLEVVSCVNDIPKGSRLAVSTNLLGSLVAVLMRATGQAASLTGPLQEHERRLVLARALLGEWLGGSGGGWQDSGGVWPGIKLIQGCEAGEGDPEAGISRGRLMPTHHVFSREEIPEAARQALQESLVLVHGGMAQNVGPILEMVTEKYLLRCAAEWQARGSMLGILDEILAALRTGQVAAIGAATTRNFSQPIQAIIPWASTYYTEQLIERARAAFGEDFWGFWMLGGMSGGGMGFIFAPHRQREAQARMQEIMSQTKRELQHALPFAMEPVVFDYAINERGTFADLLTGDDALMPPGYYTLTVPRLLRQERHELPPARRAELDKFGAAARTRPELRGLVATLFDVLLPRGKAEHAGGPSLAALLEQHGFDRAQHEQIRGDLKEGRIGLAQNRLRANAVIEDVRPDDITDATALVAQASSRRRSLGFQPGQPGGEMAETKQNRPKADRLEAYPTITGKDACATKAGQMPAVPFTSFDKNRTATISSRNLPHWRQEGVTYFVTFRLADSLPQAVIEQFRHEREEWLRRYPGELTPERQQQLNEFLWEWQEQQLDQNMGECHLSKAPVAELVEGALRHFDGERYALGSYLLMPNHVHALVHPVMGHELSAILHSWKSFTAAKVNQLLGRTGAFWQEESFDHIVRDEAELERYGRYIQENPVKARLAAGRFRLGGGSAVVAQASSLGSSLGFQPGQPDRPKADRLEARPTSSGRMPELLRRGFTALRDGELAVVTLAAGAGSRWTQGAGICKALHPFCKLSGRHRTFIETHLAKSRRLGRAVGTPLPHIFTTSYATHQPTADFLARVGNYGYDGPLHLSPGRSVGLRFVPTERDLRFAWEEMPQQMLDEQQQKVRDSLHAALIGWARTAGEASDYTDNVPLQCLHPVGHFYEVPNLFRNGVLAQLLTERPHLKYLLLHNIDTCGVDADPVLLGQHIESGAGLTFEVITRRLEDRGGGLARVNGRPRIVEGLAMPREEAEFVLSYYNSMTTWIDLDQLLTAFGLSREDILAAGRISSPAASPGVQPALSEKTGPTRPGKDRLEAHPTVSGRMPELREAQEKIAAAIRTLAAKLPTYVTLKDVKKRWGHGQEDIFPVAQFEKLWSDLTALPELGSCFVVVPRLRGQQLKDQAQLDGWLRDGSATYVESLCEWE